jgi:DUF4097 and DUF4098 domain-containing protein YvlB
MKRSIPWLAALALGLGGVAGATQDPVDPSRGTSPQVSRGVFEVQSGGKLTVDLKTGGSIEVVGWDQQQVTVEARRTGEDWEQIEVKMHGDPSGVQVRSRLEGRWRHIDAGLELTIRVPARYDLDLESMGGEFRIEGVEGRLAGRSMGGDLTLLRLKGEVDLQTMGGDVTLTDSDLDGRVHTMGGQVEVENVVGDVRATSMGGNVSLKNVTRRSGSSTGNEVRISSMGGDIRVDEAAAGANVHTMGGDIRIRTASDHVRAKTMGGDILIQQIDGWVQATTMGGDIEVTMTGDPAQGKRDVTLVSMGGDVTLTVPEGLSMDVEIRVRCGRKHEGRCRIDSDFELQRSEEDDREWEFGGRRHTLRASGTIAGGKNRVRLETVHGTVTLKRAPR